jgi:hypothetical protein
MTQHISKIAALNDSFRINFIGGKVLKTRGIHHLPKELQIGIIAGVQSYNHFNKDNDPHGEHDLGSITVNGYCVFWKIDYYDTEYKYHSPNAADPDVTVRVLTIMLEEEY